MESPLRTFHDSFLHALQLNISCLFFEFNRVADILAFVYPDRTNHLAIRWLLLDKLGFSFRETN